MRATPAPGGPTFVARWSGAWFTFDRPDSAAVRATAAELALRWADPSGLASVEDPIRSGPTLGPVQPLQARDLITPVAPWVGVLTVDGVVVEGRHGVRTALGRDDLEVLDRLTGTCTVEAFAQDLGTDVVTATATLDRLRQARCVRKVEPSTDEQASSDTPASSEATPTTPTEGAEDSEPVGATATWTHRIRAWARRPSATERKPVPDERARIPVWAPWHRTMGPPLSLGMLTASARHHRDGHLLEHFDIHRPEAAAEVLEQLAHHVGPGIVLCSDYTWTIDDNLAFASEARRLAPDLVFVHGGPSCPKYAPDAEQFLTDHADVAHVLARGEGEQTICELLEALTDLPFDDVRLAGVAGITFRAADGSVVRTEERDRIADLDQLPSPYLTGEFDHIPTTAWREGIAIETNRGCPFRCTFCDWGSATNSRIRRFDPTRVEAEVRWASERRSPSIVVTDANFGVTSRDLDTAKQIVAAKLQHGFPTTVVWLPAKNTVKRIVPIVDTFTAAGIKSMASIGMQSMDEDTLAVIDRANISTDAFVAYAADLRRRGFCLTTDLMLGLAGQTYRSHLADHQVVFDLELVARTHETTLLPNAPMNDPEYRVRHALVVDGESTVVATATADREDIQRMIVLRRVYTAVESFGLLRHVLRWLQWDHGQPATHVMDDLITASTDAADRYPALAWIVHHIDQHPAIPVGWGFLSDEIARFVHDHYGVDEQDSALATVLEVQGALLPGPERTYPSTTPLAHDYVEYYLGATDTLFRTGQPGWPAEPLHERDRGELVVDGDPLDLGATQNGRDTSYLRDFFNGWYYADAWTNELDSPLLRVVQRVQEQYPVELVRATTERRERRIGVSFQPTDGEDDDNGPTLASRVALLPRSSREGAR